MMTHSFDERHSLSQDWFYDELCLNKVLFRGLHFAFDEGDYQLHTYERCKLVILETLTL